MDKTICELFAGVGGFRVGFDRLNSGWTTVWFSQWEPNAKRQWAHDCYVKHFGECLDLNRELHTNDDISLVDKTLIPSHTLLVGGFPCQDYSVAQSLSTSKGIEGKKGVLWWQIRDTIEAKRPHFCIFENVDRLLKSPSKQRGRDFGIILGCLRDLGYSVEWRVVNAADYGAAQRRRRIFIFAFSNDTNLYNDVSVQNPSDLLSHTGFMAKSFPIETMNQIRSCKLIDNLTDLSNYFKFDFENAGIMINDSVYTARVTPKLEPYISLGSILQSDVDDSFYIKPEKLEKWEYLKGSKKINRTSKSGHSYLFSEGAISFPEDLSKPSRTMLTSESTLNRSTHVVKDPNNNRLRILTPIEAERLQGFDDDWTNTGMPLRMRYFCMGNALVVNMISRMGAELDKIIEKEP